MNNFTDFQRLRDAAVNLVDGTVTGQYSDSLVIYREEFDALLDALRQIGIVFPQWEAPGEDESDDPEAPGGHG